MRRNFGRIDVRECHATNEWNDFRKALRTATSPLHVSAWRRVFARGHDACGTRRVAATCSASRFCGHLSVVVAGMRERVVAAGQLRALSVMCNVSVADLVAIYVMFLRLSISHLLRRVWACLNLNWPFPLCPSITDGGDAGRDAGDVHRGVTLGLLPTIK